MQYVLSQDNSMLCSIYIIQSSFIAMCSQKVIKRVTK